jgi:ComF family protein
MFGRRESIVNQLGRFRLTGPRALARLLAATVFPPRCCLCGFPGASLDLDLCTVCHDDLPWEVVTPAGALVALRYEYPVDDLIRRLKYRGEIANARVLGVLLAEAARRRGAELPRLLVPVPLHPGRWRERGFNQAAALARYAGLMLNILVERNALRRVRDTPSQTALARQERHRNVRGAFEVNDARGTARLAGVGHVAIVDDVMTTGSTLSEARAALLAAGVRQVDLWAVARAE